MALKSTIFKANLQIADIDHGYYADHALTLARHPSETDERMMVRLVALALQAHELQDTCGGDGTLAFGAGLSDPDDPDASARRIRAAIAARHGTDAAQATRVERTALVLFDQVADDWGLDAEHRDWLKWCTRIHEVGLSIAHSLHHHHGAYLVGNSDLFGFTTEEQLALAFIVRAQRRAVPVELLGTLPARLAGPLLDEVEAGLAAAGARIAHLKVLDECSSGFVKAALCAAGAGRPALALRSSSAAPARSPSSAAATRRATRLCSGSAGAPRVSSAGTTRSWNSPAPLLEVRQRR